VGEGYTVNLPVPPGAGSDEFLSLVQQVVVPIGRAFAPELIAISAGYDAHRDDPLAECELEADDFGEMAAMVGSLAGELDAPVLVCLEGGYNREALATSVLATVEALAGGREPGRAPVEPAGAHRERQREHWPQI
jgi:acetoin utilization deacetylase AcuC-like enzyme